MKKHAQFLMMFWKNVAKLSTKTKKVQKIFVDFAVS